MFPENPLLESQDSDDEVDKIDLYVLAEKIAQLLLRELAIELERTGR